MAQTVAVAVPAALVERLAGRLPGNVRLVVYDENAAVPLPDDIASVEGIIRWWAGKRFDDVLAAAPKARWLHTASAGLDYLLTPRVVAQYRAGNIKITNSAGAFEGTMAEFVMGWVLMIARRMPELLQAQRDHVWRPFTQTEVAGKTLGVIGVGTIAKTLSKRARAFDMRLLCQRRAPDQPVPEFDETLSGPEGLERLLRESDYIVIAAALTPETKNMISTAQLNLMKPTAWLINVARGGLVDEPALIEALQQKRIGGACLDVFATEPLPQDSPLWTLDNVLIAPHNSTGLTPELFGRQADLIVDNITKFASNVPLDYVDADRGY